MATELDLANAQFIGFGIGKQNWNGIIELIESMGLTEKEWEKWKNNYPNVLDDADFQAIDNYFEEQKLCKRS